MCHVLSILRTLLNDVESGIGTSPQVRMERVRLRTEQARQLRHAKILRTAWQTHSGVTWQDLVVACLATATVVGVLHMWSPLWGPDVASGPKVAELTADDS